jgi:hypothetical protein
VSSRGVLTEKARSDLLTICREITRVLEGFESRAGVLGTTPHHAALQASLAVFLSRLEAGDSSLSLLLDMNSFGRDYNAYVELIAPR